MSAPTLYTCRDCGDALTCADAGPFELCDECAEECGTGTHPVRTLSGTVRVTPGVLDADAIAAFTSGQCHALALAIHEQTGWPLIAVGSECCWHSCGTMPSGLPHCAVQHVGVLVPGEDDDEARWLDVFGVRPVSQVLDPSEDWDALIGVDAADASWIAAHWLRPATEVARSFVPALIAGAAR